MSVAGAVAAAFDRSRLPAGLASASAVEAEAFSDGLVLQVARTISEWADECRMLSKSASADWGQWKTSKTPYLREIMDSLSPSDPTTEVVFQKCTQIGGTECANNFIGYIIDHGMGPTMMVQPTSNASKKVSKTRITPMISDTPTLRSKVRDARSRDSGNTTLLKEFEGGVLIMAGANSATELKSSPVKNLLLDETEEYPADVDGQGDPEKLAQKRQDTFGRRKKTFRTSTPTIEGGRIDVAYKASDQRLYHVPCPHCGHFQPLRWTQMRWETRRVWETVDAEGTVHAVAPDTPGAVERDTRELLDVYYECAGAGCRVDEVYKTDMLARGQWIAQHPGPDRPAGFKINALYSPLGWYSWRQAVLDHFEAERDLTGTKKKTFTNTVLGEAYEEQGETVDVHFLKQRIDVNARLCSNGGHVRKNLLLLTAGVDVQHNRLECYVWGWGRDLESGLVDRIIIHGSATLPSTWDALEDVLRKGFTHAGGGTLRIAAMAIDAGDGTTTHHVRWFARKWADTKRVIAVKGQSVAGKALLGKPTDQDINWHGETLKKSVKLWPYGADYAKGALYARLKVAEPGPGFVHIPSGLPDEFFDQITAETRKTRYLRGQPRTEWILPQGRANEALDCAGMAQMAAEYTGMARMNWDQLEKLVNPTQQDLFAGKPAARHGDGEGVAAASASVAAPASPAAAVSSPAFPATGQPRAGARRMRRPGGRH